MSNKQHILPIIISVLFFGSMLFSCGQSKGRYEIDTLIDAYALEDGISEKEEIVELPAPTAETLPKDSIKAANDSAPETPVIIYDNVRVKALGRLADVFNDSNYQQYAYAERIGIEPITDLAKAYHTRRPIVKVASNPDYTVAELTHSLPYLVPEASRLLSKIGENFRDSLKSKGKAKYRITVTSLLRTPATVRQLRRVNINATDSSTHQFGTTFDISYHRFDCLDHNHQLTEEALKNVLAEVLYDLRRQGRCLVKYESKTGCYHVTVTR